MAWPVGEAGVDDRPGERLPRGGDEFAISVLSGVGGDRERDRVPIIPGLDS